MRLKLSIFILIMLLLSNPLFSSMARVEARETIDTDSAFIGGIITLGVGFLLNRSVESPRVEEVGKREIEGAESYSSDELRSLMWLGQIITGEARGEPYEGQVAVAAVILNRVESDQFEDSVYDIIHSSDQFAAITDQQAFLEPTDQAYEAAKEALEGRDPTNGALFFYNPDPALYTSGIKWLEENTEKIIRIGNHVFSK